MGILKRMMNAGLAGLSVMALLGAPDQEGLTRSENAISESPESPRPASVLAQNDLIQVKVYQEEDLETRGIIDKNGMINLPLLGPVKVGGQTLDQARQTIHELYAKDYL